MRSGFICSEYKQKVLIAKLTSAKKKKKKQERKEKKNTWTNPEILLGLVLSWVDVWLNSFS